MVFRVLPLVVTLTLAGQVARAPVAPPRTYNETADAKTLIAAAIKAAATDDIRVLINWGANDDERCRTFKAAQSSRDVSSTFFLDEYRQVYVDVGHLDRNLDVAKQYGAAIEAGALPALTVLDQNGKVLANISSRALASSDATGFDTKKISAFLTTHQAPAPDAVAPFEAAVKQAKRDGKSVFVWFSAPW
jgi:hypothetical protein